MAVDGSPNSDEAARAAAYLAASLERPLHVVHAWAPMVTAFGPAGVPPMDIESAYREPAQALLDEQVDRLTRAGARIAGSHLSLGGAADEVSAVAESLDASLIVIGSRHMRALGRVVLGSVSDGVVHRAKAPVLVLHAQPHAWPPAGIIVGDDGSEQARRAAHVAGSIAAATGIPLTVATVVPGGWVEAGSPAEARALEAARGAGDTMTRELAEQVEATHGVTATTRLLSGEPGQALCDAAAGPTPSMVVVGSRGLGGLGRLALGSVSTHLLHSAPGAVLVCPAGADAF